MFKKIFPSPETRAWIRSGGAAPFVRSYAMSLHRAGFKLSTLRQRSHTAAHLGHWVESEGRSLRQLDEGALRRFRDHLATCTCPHSRPGEHSHTAVGAERFVQHLRTVGAIAQRLEGPEPGQALVYLELDPLKKLQAVAGAIPPALRPGKFRPPDRLIASLRGAPIMRSETRRPRRGTTDSTA